MHRLQQVECVFLPPRSNTAQSSQDLSTAADAGVAAFSYCSGCRKVSVQTPYCSRFVMRSCAERLDFDRSPRLLRRECQVSDYKKHKSFCSKGATPSTPSPVTTGLNTALTRQAAALASRPTATWIIFDIEKGQHLPIELRTPSTDPAVLKIVESDRKRIIAIRNRESLPQPSVSLSLTLFSIGALNDKDPLSIGLLAENVLYKPRTPQSPLVRTLVADQLASNEKLWLMKRAQLKKEFEVDDAGLDAYLKRADGCKEEWRLQMLKEQELAA